VRYPGARHSRDADLLYSGSDTPGLESAISALQEAAKLDLGDSIGFMLYDRTKPSENHAGITARFGVFVGTGRLTIISVDVVVDHVPIGNTVVAPLTPVLDVRGVEDWPDIQLYPVVDHVADKICAIVERRGIDNKRVSTRYRDLIDLVLISRNEEIDGAQLHQVLRREVLRRQGRGIAIELPQCFAVPDRVSWTSGYARAVKDVDDFDGFRTLAPAEQLAAMFIDPLLADDPPGSWQPTQQAWV